MWSCSSRSGGTGEPEGCRFGNKIQARIAAARAEMQAGANPAGLIFPSPRGQYWRSSNFDRRVLAAAYLAAGWREPGGNGQWTWHSLRHVFCVTALFTWKLDATDVSCMAGHANVRTTWTCTSAPPSASSTAPAQPPHNQRAHGDLPPQSSAAISRLAGRRRYCASPT